MAIDILNFDIVAFGTMLDRQKQLQYLINKGKDIKEFTDEERMEAFRTNALALMSELFEALGETGWKPWATSNHLNVEAFHGELVDMFHFFMNMMLHSGMTAKQLFDGYMRKVETNTIRQLQGYDGVSGKCPRCRRAYDDDAVKCKPQQPPDASGSYWPAFCERDNESGGWETVVTQELDIT